MNVDLNRNAISATDAEYKPAAKATCEMTCAPVKTKGIGPAPRFKHSAECFKGYYIVHGGRNDSMYCDNLKTVAFNDFHMLDMRTNTWNTVALFADEIPESRWGHSLCASTNRLLIFGGMNLYSYCESVCYEVVIGK